MTALAVKQPPSLMQSQTCHDILVGYSAISIKFPLMAEVPTPTYLYGCMIEQMIHMKLCKKNTIKIIKTQLLLILACISGCVVNGRLLQ